MELSIAIDRMAPNEQCGCGAKSEFFGRRIISRAARLAPSSTGVGAHDRIALEDRRRRRGKSLHSGQVVKAEKHQPWSPRTMARRASGRCRRIPSTTGEFAGERDERRDFVLRAQRRIFYFKESVGVEAARSWETFQNGKWRFMSAAAAAGLSLTLCSSAVASPITVDGPLQMPTAPFSENVKAQLETQLKHDLQAQMKVQKDWLDEIGQPLSQWSIDENVRKGFEEKARSRLDESGKPVSKLEMLESEVIPIFKPPLIASKKEELADAVIASSTTTKAPQDESSFQAVGGEPIESSTLTTTTRRASELVAVAAIPLGPVVSAASLTVGSATSIAAMGGTGTAAVPGVSLLARIMTHFGGGGVAGAMGATLVYPLDTIKTRMQAQSDEEEEETQYKDAWDCCRQLVAKEGVGSLYSGLVPQLMGIAPEKAMKLTVNEILMEMLKCQMPGVGPWALELIAGGGGGFSQVVFTNPMEIVKVRLQTQAKAVKQKNSWDVIKELGVRGLYNGSTVTMARDIPGSAIFFAVYTLIRQVYPDQSFVAAFMAAIPATVVVTPFDVVKTRLQMERADGEVPYENGYACFVTILQKEGVGALFKGSVARVLKTSPQFGITLMLYNLLCGGDS